MQDPQHWHALTIIVGTLAHMQDARVLHLALARCPMIITNTAALAGFDVYDYVYIYIYMCIYIYIYIYYLGAGAPRSRQR